MRQSFDQLTQAAGAFGLVLEENLIPVEHVLRDDRHFPCVIVMTQDNRPLHYVVLWAVKGDRVELMDPAQGFVKMSRREFESRVYVHEMEAPQQLWFDDVRSERFSSALFSRICDLGISRKTAHRLLASSMDEPEAFGRLEKWW